MKKLLLFALSLSLGTISPARASGGILAVFAHPDDETAVAPLLAKYAAEGRAVHLAILTSGQVGDSNTDIPRGEELGAARELEAQCACRALGIQPPLMLRFMDGELSHREVIPRIRERLIQVIDEVKPSVLITWGPDGLSGHPDHRTVSNVTTEIFQSSNLRHQPDRLYYVAFPKSLLESLPAQAAQVFGAGGLVDDRWITTVTEGAEQLDKVSAAVQCHRTQWPPQMMEMLRMLYADLMGGRVYLRLVFDLGRVSGPRTGELFDSAGPR